MSRVAYCVRYVMLLAVVAAVLGSPSPAVPTTLLVGGEQYQWPFGSTPQLRSEDRGVES